MFSIANWSDLEGLRSKLRARGFDLPRYYAGLCSEFCDRSFSEEDYLAEADAVALHNAKRDPFDPARPPQKKNRFDDLVVEKLGTLSWADQHHGFHAKIDDHKLKEAEHVVPVDDILVHDAIAQQDYCAKVAEEQGFRGRPETF